LFTQPEDIVGIGKDLLARRGQFEAPPLAVEQRLAQAALQLLDLRGKGGLGGMDLFSRMRERPLLGYAPEVEQMPEIQLTNVHCSILENDKIL
jgi:hypothetical protein